MLEILAGLIIALLIILLIEIRAARKEAQSYLDAIAEMISDNLESLKPK